MTIPNKKILGRGRVWSYLTSLFSWTAVELSVSLPGSPPVWDGEVHIAQHCRHTEHALSFMDLVRKGEKIQPPSRNSHAKGNNRPGRNTENRKNPNKTKSIFLRPSFTLWGTRRLALAWPTEKAFNILNFRAWWGCRTKPNSQHKKHSWVEI